MQYSNPAAGRVQGLPGQTQAVQYSQYGAEPRQYPGMPSVGQSQLGQSSYGRFGGQGQGQYLSQSQTMVPYGGNSQMVQSQHSLQQHSMNTLSGPVNPPAFYPDLSASRMGAQAPAQQGQLVQQPQNAQVQPSQTPQQQQVSTAPQQNQPNEPMTKEDRELFTPLQEARSAVEGMLRDDEMAIPTMDGLLSSKSTLLFANSSNLPQPSIIRWRMISHWKVKQNRSGLSRGSICRINCSRKSRVSRSLVPDL